ncbi:response regulator [Aeromicrobium sp.]|uniref:response regulator n=1 Tax=Aeromicrobium sp. TaxID=1871063 RepID=UPI0025C36FA2|nr:response regulator [Aeromicrobium sp.]MCK5892515.1 response regulator [Aeromicrobium sp.]
MTVRTLVVEDDPVIAAAHAEFVSRVDGFSVAGIVHRGSEAWDFVATHEVDLVLLDFYLPDMTGLDVCRGLRSRGYLVDIIAVTSARDVRVVRSVVAYGVVQYLLKPFTFAAFKDKLQRYADFRTHLDGHDLEAAQQDVDRALDALRGTASAAVPKGMSESTLTAVVDVLRATPAGVTAHQLSEQLGMARVTARRYLEHLAGASLVDREPRYGRTGRPENVYRWRRHT